MVKISFILFLSIIEYLVYSVFLFCSVFYMYSLLTTKEERNLTRMKLQKQINDNKNKLADKENQTELQVKFEKANISLMTAFRYQLIRLILLLVTIYFFLIVPIIETGTVGILEVVMVISVFVLTEPKIRFSIINVLLDFIIKRSNRAKVIEMFTLFDMIKADLNTLSDSQEVNVYNTIKNVQPMFKHIKGTLSKFLSLWKRSPKKARDTFHNELGGDNAKALADILYKLDHVSKKEALHVIEAESNTFSVQYYQNAIQQNSKVSTGFFTFFLLTNFMAMAWLIIFVFNIYNTMNGTTNL